MPAAVTIRAVQSFDAALLAPLCATLGYPTAPDQVESRLAPILESPHHAVFLGADGEGQILGWVHVFTTWRLVTDPFVELGGLVVAPDHSRKGIGRLLLAAAENWAIERGFIAMRIRSRETRSEAHDFYKRQGYKLIKDQKVYTKLLKP